MNSLVTHGLDFLPQGVVIHDLDGQIVYCNIQAQKLLGLTKDQIQGKTSLDPQWRTFHEDMSPFDGSKHPSSITFERKVPVSGVIMGVHRPDQSMVWLTIDSNPMFDDDGEFNGVIVTFTEASNVKERQEQFKQISQYLETILETAPIVLWSCDNKGIFTFSRGSGLEALGLAPDEVVGISMYDLYKDYPGIIESVTDALEGIYNHQSVTVQGRTYDSYYMPIKSGSKVIGAAGVSYDITEVVKNKALIRQQQELLMVQSRHAAMGEMLGMIAHQWRQPLTVISMIATNMSMDMELGKSTKETITTQTREIIDTTQFLSKTIDDFRDFFKPNKDKVHASVCSIMEQAISIIGKSLELNSIDLQMRCDSHQQIAVYDRELMQVFINIINNAKDALLESLPEIAFVKIAIYDTDDAVVITIRDNAGGINPDIIYQIFEPYFTTKHSSTGTGLGLYMSKLIVEKHMRGKISASNTEDGAQFVINLPLTAEEKQ